MASRRADSPGVSSPRSGADAAVGHLLDGGDAVHLWHAQVHEHDVGLECVRTGDSLTTVRRMTEHAEPGIAGEHAVEPVTHDGVIVDDEQPDDGGRSMAVSGMHGLRQVRGDAGRDGGPLAPASR